MKSETHELSGKEVLNMLQDGAYLIVSGVLSDQYSSKGIIQTAVSTKDGHIYILDQKDIDEEFSFVMDFKVKEESK